MQYSIETDRLLLRRLTDADVDNLVDLDSDPEVMRYLSGGPPTPRELIEANILPRFQRASAGSMGFGYWAAIEKHSGDFLGWFSFHPEEDGNPGEVTLGYRLRKAIWGKGYATEGASALIRKGFTELGVQRVTAITYQDNLASRRVMEKTGMQLVRAFRPTSEELLATGTYASASGEIWEGDDVEYALTRSDWEQQAAHHKCMRRLD